uniref:C-type lectin domain family 4 member A-like n=1 Tax=Callospermophilus lateralis TaxID=76772 RepID=UPI004038B870
MDNQPPVMVNLISLGNSVFLSFNCGKPAKSVESEVEIRLYQGLASQDLRPYAPRERKVCSYCPKNWKSFSSSCYFFSTDGKSWKESQDNCSRMEAHLMVINSKEEQDFLTQNMDKTAAYFVQLSDRGGQGHWQWVGQTPYNQSAIFWHPGEPSHSEEHRVVVNHHPTSLQWGWNNALCKNHEQSDCEMLKIYL